MGVGVGVISDQFTHKYLKEREEALVWSRFIITYKTFSQHVHMSLPCCVKQLTLL